MEAKQVAKLVCNEICDEICVCLNDCADRTKSNSFPPCPSGRKLRGVTELIETSFKAGQKDAEEKGLKAWEDTIASGREAIEAARKTGIREVVEWVRSKPRIFSKGYGFASVISDSEWQAKLKEWGIA